MSIVFPVHPRTRQRLKEVESVTAHGMNEVEDATARVETGASPVPRSEASGKSKDIASLRGFSSPTLRLLDPLPYLEFLAPNAVPQSSSPTPAEFRRKRLSSASPCLTVRENTERPITVTMGTNQLVGRDLKKLRAAVERILNCNSEGSKPPDPTRIPLWDGHASERIAQIIVNR